MSLNKLVQNTKFNDIDFSNKKFKFLFLQYFSYY